MALVLVLLLLPINAYAYLDPASGSAIVYIVISVASAGFFYLRNFIFDFYHFVAMKLKFKHVPTLNNELVFYSEGKQYWYVFEPILQALKEKGVNSLFLTSDKNDEAFKFAHENLQVSYIGSQNVAGAYLRQIRANVLAMTTPQLDVLTIKRSKNVKHYCHIVHAPVDVFTYRKFAFDYFDSVFCSGPHQIKSIRALETKRQTSPKELLEVGCTYYDHLIEETKKIEVQKNLRKVVLVAPTWKEYSLLHNYGGNFFEKLLAREDLEVILRPHPQIYVSYPEVITSIETQFKSHPRFSIDRNPSGALSMKRSDVMISDLSGIIWDYVYLFQKPVLLMKTPLNLEGFEATEIDHTMWELESIPKIGRYLDESDIDRIGEIVTSAVIEKQTDASFRDATIYNWGQAGAVAASKLIEIANRYQG